MSVEDNPENVKICLEICGNCPSFPKISGEVFYCARGRSKSKIEREGCICPGCDVYEKYDLSGTYFCAEGKAE